MTSVNNKNTEELTSSKCSQFRLRSTSSPTTESKRLVGEDSCVNCGLKKADHLTNQTPARRDWRDVKQSAGATSPTGSSSSSSSSSGVGSSPKTSKPSSSGNIDPRYVEELENDFFDLEDRFGCMSAEVVQLREDVASKSTVIVELENLVTEYRGDVVKLERRCHLLQGQMDRYKSHLSLPESDQSSEFETAHSSLRSLQASQPTLASSIRSNLDIVSELGDDASSTTTLDAPAEEKGLMGEDAQWRRLTAMEQVCQELMEENDALKEEVQEMQREIEEMHDKFQEDNTDVLSEVKRELEQSNKNYRIVQFKLRKAERRHNQCEAEKAILEEKLKHFEDPKKRSGNNTSSTRLLTSGRPGSGVTKEIEEGFLDDLLDSDCTDPGELMKALRESRERERDLADQLRFAEMEMNNLRRRLKLEGDELPMSLKETKHEQKESNLEEIESDNNLLRKKVLFLEKAYAALNADKKGVKDKNTVGHTNNNQSIPEQQTSNSTTANLYATLASRQLPPSRSTSKTNHSSQSNQQQISLPQPERPQLGTLRKARSLDTSCIDDDSDLLGNSAASWFTASPPLAPVEDDLASNLQAISNTRGGTSILGLRDKLRQAYLEIARLEKENHSLLNRDIQQQSNQNTLFTANNSTTVTGLAIGNNLTLSAATAPHVREFERRLRRVIREIQLKCCATEAGGVTKRERQLLDRYNDAREALKEWESKAERLQQRIIHLQTDKLETATNENTQSNSVGKKKLSERMASTGLQDGGSSKEETLWQEIRELELEVDNLSAALDNSKQRATLLSMEGRRKEDMIEELRLDHETREKELSEYAAQLEDKNGLLSNLLEIVQDRANDLQEEFDKLLTGEACQKVGDGSKNLGGPLIESQTSGVSAISGCSTGSDDVFSEHNGSNGVDERLKSRLRCLERLLAEERQRTRVAEKQLEISLKDSPRSKVQPDTQLKHQEIELLKKELEEKEEQLEEQDLQVRDLKNRLEQSRKMNDAMKSLCENVEPTTEFKSKSEKSNLLDDRQHQIEISSYRKDLQEMKKDLAKMTQDRDHMAKEVHSLQEELKIREDSIFEQDDEMERTKTEMRRLHRLLDEEHQKPSSSKEMESLVKARDSAEDKVQAMGAEVVRLEEKIQELIGIVNQKHAEMEEANEKVKQISEVIRIRDDRIREKDELLVQMNQRLRDKETESISLNEKMRSLSDLLTASQTANGQLRNRAEHQEKEMNALRNKVEEAHKVGAAQSSKELAKAKAEVVAIKTEMESKERDSRVLKEEIKRLKGYLAAASTGSSGSSSRVGRPPPSSGSSTSAGIGVGGRELERVKREVIALKREKQERETQYASERKQWEKKLAAQTRDAFAKSNELSAKLKDIQQDESPQTSKLHTRINLLTDYISRLNSAQIDLKLQNESLQRDVIDYQRKYRLIRQQYEIDQTKWIQEKSLLETRAKDQEDRKVTIAHNRKYLHEAAIKTSELEALCASQKLEFENVKSRLELEKLDLQSRITQIEEDRNKGPKVLQRFTRAKTPTTTDRGTVDKEKADLRSHLETKEEQARALRASMVEKERTWAEEKQSLLRTAEGNMGRLEREIETMRRALLEVDGLRLLVSTYRERIDNLEDTQERERRQVMEERMSLRYCTEEASFALDTWMTKLKETLAEFEESEDNKSEKEQLTDDVINFVEGVKNLVDDMERYLKMKEKSPYAHLKRRWPSNAGSLQRDGSVPPSPSGSMILNAPRPAFSSLLNIGPPRYGSMTGLNPSNATSGSHRVNRSVSPDVSVRKVTNYPDPMPGFFLRSTSRQNSNDSLSNASMLRHPSTTDHHPPDSGVSDLRSPSFTGTPFSSSRRSSSATRSKVSPARQKFFAEYDTPTATSPNIMTTSQTSNYDNDPSLSATFPRAAKTTTPSGSSTNVSHGQPRSILASSQTSVTSQERRSRPTSNSSAGKSITFGNNDSLSSQQSPTDSESNNIMKKSI